MYAGQESENTSSMDGSRGGAWQSKACPIGHFHQVLAFPSNLNRFQNSFDVLAGLHFRLFPALQGFERLCNTSTGALSLSETMHHIAAN